MAGLIHQTKNLKQSLESLADQSDRTSDIMAQLDKERSKRETITNYAEQFTFGDTSQREGMAKNVSNLNAVIGAGGNINAIAGEDRAGVQSLLDQFGDIEVANGMTGKQLKAQITAQEVYRQTGNKQLADNIAKGTSAPEEKLIAELQAVGNQEVDAIAQLKALEEAKLTELITAVNEVPNKLNEANVQRVKAEEEAKAKGNIENITGAPVGGADLAQSKKELEDATMRAEAAQKNYDNAATNAKALSDSFASFIDVFVNAPAQVDTLTWSLAGLKNGVISATQAIVEASTF